MAAYLTSGEWSDLFTRLGQLALAVQAVDHAWYNDIEASNLDGIVAQFSRYIETLVETQDEAIHSDAVSVRSTLVTSLASFNTSIVNLVEGVLNHGLIDQGGEGSFKSIYELLSLLRWYMGHDGYAIKVQDVTVTGYDSPSSSGSASAAQELVFARPANVADGDAFDNTSDSAGEPPAIFVSIRGVLKAMDDTAGDVIPTEVWKTDVDADAEEVQTVYDDDYEVKVQTDKYNGASSGAEVLSLHGTRPTDEGVYSGDFEHVGDRSPITMVSSGSGNELTNGGFETYTGSGGSLSFTGWTLATGTAGTNLDVDTTTVARGDASAELTQDTVNPKLTQSVSVIAKKKYLVTCLYKVTGAQAGATLELKLTGTGWTPTGASVSIASTGAWSRAYFFVNAPEDVPDDVQVELYLAGTVGTGVVLVDEVIVYECAQQPDGLFVIPVAGTDDYDPVVGDRWFFSVNNDRTSILQAFFTRFFNVQLPATGVTGAGYIADPTPA